MRKYRIDTQGHEQPVWASKRRLILLGEQEGRQAARENRLPSNWGNLTYDSAAQRAYRTARETEAR